MNEEWRPIAGYEGRYDVSDLGRVRSWVPYRGLPAPRLLKAPVAANGYRVVRPLSGGRGKTFTVHHLVATTFIGPKPPGMHVRHLDGDRLNNLLSNLAIGTASENVQDSIAHGTHAGINKTHCVRGHEYVAENVISSADGLRRCRTCNNERNAKKVSCPQCGAQFSASHRATHSRRHHNGRPPGRVYERQPIKHGTDGGYQAHIYRREFVPPGDPCGCRAAHAAAVLERKRRRAA